MHLLTQAIWGDTWKFIPEKNLSNANNATMHLLTQSIWGDTRKLILEKNYSNSARRRHKFILVKNISGATNATMHLFMQVIWGDTWKFILVKNHFNAANATFSLFGQAFRRDIWKIVPWGKLKRSNNILHLLKNKENNFSDFDKISHVIPLRFVWENLEKHIKWKTRYFCVHLEDHLCQRWWYDWFKIWLYWMGGR